MKMKMKMKDIYTNYYYNNIDDDVDEDSSFSFSNHGKGKRLRKHPFFFLSFWGFLLFFSHASAWASVSSIPFIQTINEKDTSNIQIDMLELDEPITKFDYLNNGALLMTNQKGKVVYRSQQNLNTKEIISEGVNGLWIHPLFNDVYILETSHLHLLKSGETEFIKYPLPGQFDPSAPPFQMNYEEGDWLLYAGTYCDNDDTHLVNTTTTTSNNNCKTYPFYSITKGKQWHYLMLPELTQCIWARTNLFTLVPKSAILCSLHSQVVYSEDFFHTYHLVLNHTSRFAIYGDYFIALSTKNKEIDSQVNNLHPSFLESKEDKEKKDELYLHVSLDAQHFGRALFPNIKPPSNAPVHPPSMSFTVLPAHKGALYINLPQYQTSLGGLGRLYKSNFNGTRFTLMHEATFWSTQRNSYGFVDIELLQSIPGFMVANFVTNADAIMNPLDSSTVVPFQKKTFFSLDEGSTWQQFKPPEHDALNQPYPCGPGFKDFPECQLHFHLYLDRVDPQHVMDASSAPGLLLGVGHVQPTLGAFKDANTYLTRDAGQTWFEIFKGPHQFEFGDHGSVIVLVHAFQPTHQLLYSFDDGRSFLSLPLSSPPRNFTLLNIFTHPNATLERFVITGVWETNTPNDPQGPSKKYVVFFVDFSSAREGTCQFDPQNKFNSDFEAWTLSDQCVFGKKTTYYRRKPGKTCAIRNTFKLYEHSDQRCPCTKQDFECDYNYEMNDSGECVTTQPPLDLACDDQPYWVPSGYRKRSSTVCEGGLMLDAPKKYTCPRPLSSSFSIYFGLLMILAVGGLAYVFSVVYKRLKNSGVDFHIPGSSFVTGLFSDLQYRFQYRPVGSYGRNDTSLLGED